MNPYDLHRAHELPVQFAGEEPTDFSGFEPQETETRFQRARDAWVLYRNAGFGLSDSFRQVVRAWRS